MIGGLACAVTLPAKARWERTRYWMWDNKFLGLEVILGVAFSLRRWFSVQKYLKLCACQAACGGGKRLVLELSRRGRVCKGDRKNDILVTSVLL